jgi:hypothetical protein
MTSELSQPAFLLSHRHISRYTTGAFLRKWRQRPRANPLRWNVSTSTPHSRGVVIRRQISCRLDKAMLKRLDVWHSFYAGRENVKYGLETDMSGHDTPFLLSSTCPVRHVIGLHCFPPSTKDKPPCCSPWTGFPYPHSVNHLLSTFPLAHSVICCCCR